MVTSAHYCDWRVSCDCSPEAGEGPARVNLLMEGLTVVIEIASLKYPLRLRGRVGRHEWRMFGKGDHWCFYVEHALHANDHLFALTAKFPNAEQMPQITAIRIADACAKHFERLSTVKLPLQ